MSNFPEKGKFVRVRPLTFDRHSGACRNLATLAFSFRFIALCGRPVVSLYPSALDSGMRRGMTVLILTGEEGNTPFVGEAYMPPCFFAFNPRVAYMRGAVPRSRFRPKREEPPPTNPCITLSFRLQPQLHEQRALDGVFGIRSDLGETHEAVKGDGLLHRG